MTSNIPTVSRKHISYCDLTVHHQLMFQPTGGSATALHSSPLLLNMSAAAAAAAAAAADKSSTTGAAPVNHQSLMGVTSSNSSAKVSVCAYILHVHVVLFLNACSNCIVPYCLQFSLSRIRFLYTPCTIIVSLNLSGRKNFRATHTVTLT